MKTRSWPVIAHGLLREFDEERVYRIGTEALKFPPTWIHTQNELKRLRKALT